MSKLVTITQTSGEIVQIIVDDDEIHFTEMEWSAIANITITPVQVIKPSTGCVTTD